MRPLVIPGYEMPCSSRGDVGRKNSKVSCLGNGGSPAGRLGIHSVVHQVWVCRCRMCDYDTRVVGLGGGGEPAADRVSQGLQV